MWTGLSDTYVPVEVAAEAGAAPLRNRLAPVRIEGVAEGERLRGAVWGRVLV